MGAEQDQRQLGVMYINVEWLRVGQVGATAVRPSMVDCGLNASTVRHMCSTWPAPGDGGPCFLHQQHHPQAGQCVVRDCPQYACSSCVPTNPTPTGLQRCLTGTGGPPPAATSLHTLHPPSSRSCARHQTRHHAPARIPVHGTRMTPSATLSPLLSRCDVHAPGAIKHSV